MAPTYICILVVLVLLSGMFSMLETAFSSMNMIKIKRKAKRGNKKAIAVYHLSGDFSFVITTLLIFNNIVNIAASSLATFLFSSLFGVSGVFYSTIVMTVVILIFGEITPKIIAKSHPESIVLSMIYVLKVLIFITYPIGFVVSKIESFFRERGHHKKDVTATQSELLEIVQTIESEGVINQDERELIESALEFDDKQIRHIMVAMEDVVYLDENSGIDDIKKAYEEHGYSRIPVLNSKHDEVIGILHESDAFRCLLEDKNINVKELVREPILISECRRLPLALTKLQKSKSHMAIVVNNLKECELLGIVTLEDILEEIVGEIYDEHDEIPLDIVEIGHHSFEVNPKVNVRDFFKEYLDLVPPKIGKKNFRDWLISLNNGKELQLNQEFVYENITMKIASMNNDEVEQIDVEIETKEEDI